MFKDFIKNAKINDYDFSGEIYPLADNRSFWESFPVDELFPNAEKYLEYTWPPIKATDFMEFKKSGDRKIMENIHFERRRALEELTFAELHENNGRFLPQIVNGIFAICEESYWGVSAHGFDKVENIPSPEYPYIDLFAAETAEHLAAIYSMLYGKLYDFCPEILARIEYELERRIKVPYLTHKDYWWMGYGKRIPNNWNPWIISNVMSVFLVTEKNKPRLFEAVKKMFGELQIYYDNLPADGGCDEGPGYWGRAGASLFECVYQLKLATNGCLGFFDDEKFKMICSYMKKVHITGGFFVNFADAHPTESMGSFPMIYGFARETEQPEMMNFSAAIFNKHSSASVMYDQCFRRVFFMYSFIKNMKNHRSESPIHGELEYLPSLEVAALRKNGLFLCAKGGNNKEHHNHNDVGSFVFYDGNEPVLIDVGIGVYTRFTFDNSTRYSMIPWTQSPYHNLPLINGTAQKYGPEFRSSGFNVEDGRVTLELSGAYPEKAHVDSALREITLTDNGMCLTDRFEATGATEVTEYLMTALPVKIEKGRAYIGEKYVLTSDVGEIYAEFISFDGDKMLLRDWKCEGVARISVKAENVKSITLSVKKIKQ